jgi:hypothetical protein
MSATELYVRHWFEHHALSRATPTLRQHSRDWIKEAAEAHGDFEEWLRTVALEALSDSNPSIVRRGLIALAVVADVDDLSRIEALKDSTDAGVAADARATVFDIKHRAV